MTIRLTFPILTAALEKVRRDLCLPADAVLGLRAALRAAELARPGRRRLLNISQPAAPLAHPRPRRQHVRAVVLEHQRCVAAGEEPPALAVHQLSLAPAAR